MQQVDKYLRQFDTPPLRAGFATEALDMAWAISQGTPRRNLHSRARGLGLAACLLVAVSAAVWGSLWQGNPAPGIAQQTSGLHDVNLLFVSRTALPDAVINLDMDNNVRLVGFPSQRQIRWQAPIGAGANRLKLPVQMRGKSPGVIVVEVDAHGIRKRTTLTVDQSGLASLRGQSL